MSASTHPSRRPFAIVAVAVLCLAAANARADLSAVRQAMRNADYAGAVEQADAYLAKPGEDHDAALHLKSLAHFYAEQYEAAIATADELIAKHPKSSWLRKARFVKALSHTRLRQFEPAEKIYAEEANRLLSTARKHEIAATVIRFADALATEPDPDDVGATPPNYQRAYKLYRKALEMEIGRGLRDEVMFKLAATIDKASNHGQAIHDYRAYLAEFDPDWTGPVGSAERMRGQKRENPRPAGGHIRDARFGLARAQLAANQRPAARENLEDLIALIFTGEEIDPSTRALANDARWLIARSYYGQSLSGSDLERAVKASRDFLEADADHPHAVVAAWRIAEMYQNHGRADDAIAAYRAFIDGKGYKLPAGDAATEKLEQINKSPAQLLDEWTKAGLFRIGSVQFGQKKYDAAVETWQAYINRYPAGPQWASAQSSIVNARYQVGVDLLAAKRYDDARAKFNDFMQRYPLDGRAANILFTFGQVEYAAARELEEADGDRDKIDAAYRRAIDEWKKLVSKYPGTEQSSLAQYRIGLILEEELADHAAALEAYRRLNWGSYANQARARIAMMTAKQLTLTTERTFRTDEKPAVRLEARNIEKVTVRRYTLDLKAYFRKTHTIGSIEALDIALIEPDKTWEVELAGYAKYKPLEQQIEIPFEDDQPGVCLVNVASDDWEATTLVIRSDIDVIVKSSRKQVLVFAQDMRTGKAAKGVDLLVSDGSKVIHTGKTGDDGVMLATIGELKNLGDVRVFADRAGSIASNTVNLSGLGVSAGLSAKGYLYTDRPAYQPGQVVKLRGVLRDVKDGVYAVPAGQKFDVTIADAQGRVVWQAPLEAGEFGTLTAEAPLDPAAAVGQYTIRARKAGVDNAPTFSGSFQVQRFQLEKMAIALDTDHAVYFRGERVKLTLTATYQWGQPVADKAIRYQLPDGRSYVEKTDDDGKIEVEFDTAGMRPGSAMGFTASIEGENVRGSIAVPLARYGFTIAAAVDRPIILAGEPADLTVTTRSADDEPVGRELTVFVQRRQTPKPDPVITGVPWIGSPQTAASYETVSEHKLTTDEKTGKATLTLKLDKGGEYRFRVTGEDRFDQAIVATASARVSDDDDAVKLRLFADSATLKVGQDATVRLHSRLDKALALVTFEGESVIAHRVVPIKAGFTKLPIAVDHTHFPNFRVAVSLMHDRELITAAKPFTVERELKVTVEPLAEAYAPGAAGKVKLTVTDQLGKPVRAELSLALVDEALLAIYPDRTPNIRAFFERGARRHAEFRTASTCGFRYTAATQAVLEAFKEEKDRLARVATEANTLVALRSQIVDGFAMGRATNAPAPASAAMADDSRRERAIDLDEAAQTEMSDLRLERKSGEAGAKSLAYYGSAAKADKEGGGAAAAPRKERADAGFWLGSVVTDDNGVATVDVAMPGKTTNWRIVARGCTVETLVGQAESNVITRKDFFANLKLPGSLVEGDNARALARVHNLTDYAGDVKLTLVVTAPGDPAKTIATLTETVKITGRGEAEVMFEPVTAPAAMALSFELRADAGDNHDAVERAVPVRPWGLEFADHGGGVAQGDLTVLLELPKGRKYESRWMTVSVGPGVERTVIEMALGRGVWPMPVPLEGAARSVIYPPPAGPTYAGNELLAVVSALRYAQGAKAPQVELARLTERARGLIGSVVVTQNRDGGWGWIETDSTSDALITATTVWALARAKQIGLPCQQPVVDKARRYLANRFQQVDQKDNDSKATILHALAASGEADFAHANRLYRERNTLSSQALARTALALVELKRPEMAGELLDVLETKAKPEQAGQRKLCYWPGDANQPWLADSVETTAVALLAYQAARPNSPRVREAVDYLLQRRGCFGFRPAKAKGAALAGLSRYFEAGQFARSDYRVTVLVNGKEVQTLVGRAAGPSSVINVPTEALADGENRVEFRMDGRGEFTYAATLRGFSSNMADPGSLGPYIRKRYYRHADLTYRGRPIGAASSSPVRNVETGQRIKVYVDIYNRSDSGYLMIEEPIPAGFVVVPGSVKTDARHHDILDGRIVFYYRHGEYIDDIQYELAGYAPGVFRVMPTVIRDTVRPNRMRVGQAGSLAVLKPGEKSDDPYQMNDAERYALGKLYFDDGVYGEAVKHLTHLFQHNRKYNERDVARMLLWIHTDKGFYDAQKIVDAFEVLRERYPQLEIPYDKILVVGKAYRDIGEFERAFLVFRATIDASFITDSSVSAVLEDEGQFLGSIDYMQDLWLEYPDTAAVTSTYFALSQSLYAKAPHAATLADEVNADGKKQDPPTRIDLLKQTLVLLDEFLTLYPASPLADDAAFSVANAYLDLKLYDKTVAASGGFLERFAESDFASSFRYMKALGHFWQRDYDAALGAARVVADGKSKDRDFARYILGQIYHAQNKPALAIDWYGKVRNQYPDAAQSIAYFEKKTIALDEVSVFKPDEAVELELRYRNIKEAAVQVYRVDLMKLYLREKNLSNVTAVNLAGIKPMQEMTLQLGDGKDYVDKDRKLELKLDEEGAYLVIVRGDDLFTSGMALITPLRIEAQEIAQSGRVRVNVIDDVTGGYVPNVHVKAVGSADGQFKSGDTDLRGLFVADGLRGKATVIARTGDARYAFYRGDDWLGAPAQQRAPTQQVPSQTGQSVEFLKNVIDLNTKTQRGNIGAWDQLRRQEQKGVQVYQAK